VTRPAPRPVARPLVVEVPRPTVEVDVIELAELRAQVAAARLFFGLLAERRREGRNHVPLKVLQRAVRVLGLPPVR
jgi:hypothetical protein